MYTEKKRERESEGWRKKKGEKIKESEKKEIE